MKKLAFILIIILCANNMFSQEKASEGNNNIFSLSMPRLLMSTFLLSYERLFENNSSVFISGGIILKDNSYDSKIGGNGEFQYRFYSDLKKEKVFQGMYFGPYINYRYIDVKNWNYYYNYPDDSFGYEYLERNIFSTAGMGIAVGCKIAIVQKIIFGFELGGGVKYTLGSKKANYYSNIFDYGYSGIAPKADISVGIVF